MSENIIDLMHHYDIAPKHEINIISDGRVHRYKAIDDKNDNGWYVVFSNGGGLVGHWSKYGEQFFVAKGKYNTYPNQQDITRIKKELETERQQNADQARKKAEYIIKNSIPATVSHPYLHKKQITLNMLRCYKDSLIIKMYKNYLEINSLQLINPNGEKRFLKGTAKKGCYSLIGAYSKDKPLIIAEGFATASSIYQSLHIPVFIAFDCGNFKSAIEAILKHFTFKHCVIIAADNDINQISYKHAREALESIPMTNKRYIIMPETIKMDWNDVYVKLGETALKNSFIKVLS